jgi:hypothetical protein
MPSLHSPKFARAEGIVGDGIQAKARLYTPGIIKRLVYCVRLAYHRLVK